MGWTGIITTKSFDEVLKSEFEEQFISNVILKYEIVKVPKEWFDDYCTEEAEAYCAWRCKNDAITCVTILFQRVNNEVLYKLQEESVGPYMKTKCPKEIFDMLSPLDKIAYAGYAKEWRDRQIN